MPPAFAISLEQVGADRGQFRLGGNLRLSEAVPLWAELRRLEGSAVKGASLDFEMSGVERIDGGRAGPAAHPPLRR
jgi:ABC-type transporter Mla MlaB component